MNGLSDFSQLPIFQAIALAIGFPIALLVLNEWIGFLERRSNPLAKTLRTCRNLVLPSLALLLFLTWILNLPGDSSLVRWAAGNHQRHRLRNGQPKGPWRTIPQTLP
jgi:hypothetical protein